MARQNYILMESTVNSVSRYSQDKLYFTTKSSMITTKNCIYICRVFSGNPKLCGAPPFAGKNYQDNAHTPFKYIIKYIVIFRIMN